MQCLSLIIFYIVLVVTPLVIAFRHNPSSDNPFIYEVAKGFALTAFMILNLQPVLASRLKWIERPFGFDIVIRYHKYLAVFAALILVSHPLLLTSGEKGWKIITSMKVPLPVVLGRTALVLLLINISLSLFQRSIRLKFERWRVLHDVLSPAILVLIFIHSGFIGKDVQDIYQIQLLWAGMLGIAILTFAYHRFLRPLRLSRRPYKVTDVHQETKDVWTIKLAPPEDARRYDYLPGQFHFLTFHRSKDLPQEEHHWTISSSPTEQNYVSSTIKELGDFTSTIGKTKPGDTANVHAAFGRFSYVLHPEEKDFVFITGGIGITPLMSMLRHMRDTRAAIPVLLIYANKTEEDIVFRKELSEMETKGYPQLKIIHILSTPGKDWTGETGFIDREKIERFCGHDLKNKAFYVCGPPGLTDIAIKSLRELGVADNRIHEEIFSFLD